MLNIFSWTFAGLHLEARPGLMFVLDYALVSAVGLVAVASVGGDTLLRALILQLPQGRVRAFRIGVFPTNFRQC